MKKSNTILLGLGLALTGIPLKSHAQTYTAFVETGELLSSGGSVLEFGSLIDSNTVNVFYGVVNNTTIEDLNNSIDPLLANLTDEASLNPLKSALTAIDWTLMGPGPNASVQWFSGFNIPGSIGDRPVLAIMNADGPNSLTLGSELAFVASTATLASAQANITTGLGTSLPGAAGMEIIVGTAGSVQLIELAPVPEPSTFALIAGVFGLGFVMWRRRK
jgi:hypothetical protein